MKKHQTLLFTIIFCVAILSTIFFLKPHYSIDTVEFLNNGYKAYIQDKFLVDGRIFSVLLLKLVINIPMKYVIPILYVIGILISCISVMYIRKLIIKYAKTENKNLNIIPTIISYVIIFNFMYIDAFQFIEFPIIALSVLLFIISAKIIVEEEKGYMLKALILSLIAMFCYQGTINVLIATTFVISIIKRGKLDSKVVLDMLKVGIILLITILINYGFTVIVGGTSRIDFNIIKNCKNALINLYLIIFNSNSLYPEYLQLVFILIITIYYLYIKKTKILNLLWIYCVSLGINIILLITTGDGIIGPLSQWGRVFFTVGALIGYMFMYLWCTDESIRKSKFIRTIIVIYFVTIVITYFQYTYFYMKGQYIDEYIITNIDSVISQYEEKTGTKIKKYAYEIDFNNYKILETKHILNKKYNERNYTTIIGARRSYEGISSILFDIYSNRKIEKVIFYDDYLDNYFENIDFSRLELFDEKRFVFEGDTVYIVL